MGKNRLFEKWKIHLFHIIEKFDFSNNAHIQLLEKWKMKRLKDNGTKTEPLSR